MNNLDFDIIYIGKKPVMNYAATCMALFNQGKKELSIKARGNAISKAVDLVEILRRNFIKDLQVKDIQIGTDEIPKEDNRTAKVSKMDIVISK